MKVKCIKQIKKELDVDHYTTLTQAEGAGPRIYILSLAFGLFCQSNRLYQGFSTVFYCGPNYNNEIISRASSILRAPQGASLNGWGPGARLRAPGGGPGGEAPGSSRFLGNLYSYNK